MACWAFKVFLNKHRNFYASAILRLLVSECHPRANIIYGANGSGKTSLLEAIFLLGRGKSFKHRDLRLVVNRGEESLVVSGRVYRPQL